MPTLTRFAPSSTNTAALLRESILHRLSPVRELTDEEQTDKELAEKHLREFIRQSWHVIEPETDYLPNWHIDAICDHLQAARRREIRNLLITVPPRMLKSITTSVDFPAWVWIDDPHERFLYGSYSETLASEHSVACRNIIQSDWYQGRWGDRFYLAHDQNLKTRFHNSRRGHRYAVSVGGSTTGLGGTFLVCDDPHNVRDAESDLKRQEAIDWWDKSVSSRGNDPKTTVKIVIMQRIHQGDLAGHLIDKGGYVHLNLPNEYEPKTYHFTGFGKPDPRTESGDLMFPKRLGIAETANMKLDMGIRAYAGQYQQDPAPDEGAILKKTDWGYFDAPPLQFDKVLQCWDTAYKEGEENDYSVCLTTGVHQSGFYLLDLWRGKVEFPKLKAIVRDQYHKWKPDEIVIEDKGSGTSLIQELQVGETLSVFAPRSIVGGDRGLLGDSTVLPIIAWNPGDSNKLRRVHAVSPYVEGHLCKLQSGADWITEFVDECAAFPSGIHDDQVDAFTMSILRVVAKESRVRPVSVATMMYFDDGILTG
jgi:phage terminase large subunit-like protein